MRRGGTCGTGSSVPSRWCPSPPGSAEDTIERVAHAGRAVVPVVVVAVEPVFGTLVPLQKITQRRPLGRGQIQLLHPDGPVGPYVDLEGGLEIEALHPVQHASLHKPQDEVLLVEVEQPVVVGLGRAAGMVFDQNRVVTEALPDALADPHRHERHGELGAWRRRRLRDLGREPGGSEQDGGGQRHGAPPDKPPPPRRPRARVRRRARPAPTGRWRRSPDAA
jgi:hypothetical protein